MPADCIIIIVKRHDGMGKCARAYAGSRPARVFLNKHLSYAGSVRLTVDTLKGIIFVLSEEINRYQGSFGAPAAGNDTSYFLFTLCLGLRNEK